jgi:hypothetical protein
MLTSQRSQYHEADVGRGKKAESGDQVTSQTPKVGQLVDVELISWDRDSKLNCPTFLGEELTKQLQLKGKISCCLL